jgi:hypothetical protein
MTLVPRLLLLHAKARFPRGRTVGYPVLDASLCPIVPAEIYQCLDV